MTVGHDKFELCHQEIQFLQRGPKLCVVVKFSLPLFEDHRLEGDDGRNFGPFYFGGRLARPPVSKLPVF